MYTGGPALKLITTCPEIYSGRARHQGGLLFFFFTLLTGPRRFLGLKLSDTRVYAPQMGGRHLASERGRRHGHSARLQREPLAREVARVGAAPALEASPEEGQHAPPRGLGSRGTDRREGRCHRGGSQHSLLIYIYISMYIYIFKYVYVYI